MKYRLGLCAGIFFLVACCSDVEKKKKDLKER